jgi:hypothetical protein
VKRKTDKLTEKHTRTHGDAAAIALRANTNAGLVTTNSTGRPFRLDVVFIEARVAGTRYGVETRGFERNDKIATTSGVSGGTSFSDATKHAEEKKRSLLTVKRK